MSIAAVGEGSTEIFDAVKKARVAKGKCERMISEGRRVSSLARTTGPAATRAIWVWAGAIGLFALVSRLSFAISYAAHPIGRVPWVDEGAYGARAQAILGGAWLPEVPFFQDPLYPYLLAVVMRTVGSSVSTLRITFGILGMLTPMVVFAAARRGFGLAEAVVAGLLTASYGPLIFADASLGKEGPAALGAAVGLLAAASMCGASDPRRGIAWSGLAGWSWGLVALLRSNALLIAPLGSILCLREPSDCRRRLLVAFAGGFALTMAPVSLVNWVVSHPHEWILTTWQAGPNFYIGNGPQATGTYQAPDFVEPNPAREADDFATEARRRTKRSLTYGGISRYWLVEGLRWWREFPATAFQLLAKKLGLVLHNTEIPDNQDPELVRVLSTPVLDLTPVGFGVLGPSAALGILRAWRSSFGRWVVLTTALGLGSTALFFVVGRYRIPWIPGTAILSGVGLVEIYQFIKDRKIRAIARRVCLILIPSLVLGWRPIPDPAPERWGHSLIALAIAELNELKLDAAIDAFDDVRALGGGAAGRLGQLLAAGQVHDRIAAMVDARMRNRTPGGLDNLRLARILRQIPEGRPESRRILEILARQRPSDPAVRRETAAWLLGTTDDPVARKQAIEKLEKAVKQPRPDPAAVVLLALATLDPAPMNTGVLRDTDLNTTRVRLARAVLADSRHHMK